MRRTHQDIFLEPGGCKGGLVLVVAEDISDEIRNSRYTGLGLGLDGLDAEKGAAGWGRAL